MTIIFAHIHGGGLEVFGFVLLILGVLFFAAGEAFRR
jgi:hypothetical protein